MEGAQRVGEASMEAIVRVRQEAEGGSVRDLLLVL
jgi:hypothetical protein